MKKTLYLILLLLISLNFRSYAKSGVELSGDILEYAMPAIAMGSTFIWRDDSKPTWQLVKSLGTAVGTAYILKQTIKKKRPDFNEWDQRYDSFPSGHTTSAFTSAAFMERRYGWKVGIPAYLVAGYVGWSRVYSNRHDWWDVLGGAVIGTASSYLFTKAYDNTDMDLGINISPSSYSFALAYRF